MRSGLEFRLRVKAGTTELNIICQNALERRFAHRLSCRNTKPLVSWLVPPVSRQAVYAVPAMANAPIAAATLLLLANFVARE